ncbi:hypothetical protein BpHYR1_039479 [Brachionus plicatilis]|uniref:Uncharacterized protein n=1 Tax=Brachionus plicatilis TaxID=10195 RepID=A0A3M7QSS4_BRAPC|nr:hypothetical protein BpHYR1_039479 [Brachionus plicatilis]
MSINPFLCKQSRQLIVYKESNPLTLRSCLKDPKKSPIKYILFHGLFRFKIKTSIILKNFMIKIHITSILLVVVVELQYRYFYLYQRTEAFSLI